MNRHIPYTLLIAVMAGILLFPQYVQAQTALDRALASENRGRPTQANPGEEMNTIAAPSLSIAVDQQDDMTVPPLNNNANDIQMSLDEDLLLVPEDPEITRQLLEEEARGRAYERSKRTILPLETGEIRELLERLRETQEAIQTPIVTPPTPEVHVETLSLDPTSQPPKIHLSTGHVTSLTILDSTGQPWPIHDIAFGGRFDVKQPEAGGHVIRITPLEEFARGNLSVRLLDFKTPVTFVLGAGVEDVIHYRFDAQIPEMGPYADIPLMEPGGIAISPDDGQALTYLAGTFDERAGKELDVEGTDGRTRAWRSGDTLFLRTAHKMLSPTWQSSASSADGMTVYRLAYTPVVLLSDKGRVVRLRLAEKGVSYDR